MTFLRGNEMIGWILTEKQLANARPKILSTLKWMKRLHKAPTYDFEVNFEYHSSHQEWWLFINSSGCGATYTIKKNHKRWKLK